MLKFNKIALVGFFILLTGQTFSQNYFFADKDEKTITGNDLKRVLIPQKYRTVSIDEVAFLQFIKTVPDFEAIKFNRDAAPIISIPMPNGKTAQFRIWVNNTMSPGLQAKFPTIKTFTGQGITDKYAILTMDWTTQGFHAMTLSDVEGSVFIDPYAQGTTKEYVSYYRRDYTDNEGGLQEGHLGEVLSGVNGGQIANRNNTQCAGATLYNYRLAVACTGEYAVAVAGFNPQVVNVMSAIVTSVNRVDGVYEKECSVSLNLVPDNANLIYTNGSTDPYTNSNGSSMLSQNQTTVDNTIGSINYDIGHVFSTGGGGVAGLGVVCVDGNKARGVTGRNSPIGDPFDIDYVAHEMGHQFRGNHTFKANTVSCAGNGSTTTNVEPGSGTTIMAYAGICGSTNDLQLNSDPQFHGISQDEIYDFITTGSGNSCAVTSGTGNQPPVVAALTNRVIPINTPFVLTGSATDPNNDPLTYSWEQMNFGSGFYNWNNTPQVSTQPLFRSFPPTTSTSRHFPRLSDQLNGSSTVGEMLPDITRSMRFRLTARDNKAGGGGSCYNELTINVRAEGGPFEITYPNGFGINWTANSNQTVTWNVNGTTNSPISTTTVNILLSTDGGLNFNTTLASGVPNNGSAPITVPNINTNQARIRVMAGNSVYYCMSAMNFTISGAVPVNWMSFNANKIGAAIVGLNWRVNEINNLKYEIERSADNKTFNKIGEVAALTSNGNEASYYFKDEKATNGKNFYRIKQIDVDGKSSYSNTLVVNFSKLDNGKFEVYPNPAKDRASIVSIDEAKNLNIQIVDLMGKVVYTQQRTKVEAGEQISLNISNLPNGIYTIKLIGEGGNQLSVKKLVKQ